MEQPFTASYYVDPNFTGTSTGSSDSPFTSIAAAFGAALSLGLTGAIIFTPPSQTITEDVTFPDHGDWEIACQDSSRLSTIAGTVSCISTTSAPKARLTNVTVTGAISGDAGTGQSNFLVLTNCRINSTVTLTGTGTGGWTLQCIGRCTDLNSFGGFISGAVSVVGTIHATNWSFQAQVVWSVTTAQFYTCRFNTGSLTANITGISAVKFIDCMFAALTTITATAGTLLVSMDGSSHAAALAFGLILAGATTLKTLNANLSLITVDSGNRSPTVFGGREPSGLYELAFDATLLVPGTMGDYEVFVNYTDMTGAAVSVPVGSALNITLPAGSKSEGALRFHHNGSSAISLSASGVVTPGTFSVSLSAALRALN